MRGCPDNYQCGLPCITRLLVLNDLETGLPLAVMDCVWITAKRTGAATAVASRYRARPDCEVVEILGCSVQGRSNLEAQQVLFPVRCVMARDGDPVAQRRYVERMSARFGLQVVTAAGPKQVDGHAQFGQPRAIRLQHFTRPVDLLQQGYLFLMQRPPHPHTPLKGAQLPGLVALRVLFAQPFEHGLRFQTGCAL